MLTLNNQISLQIEIQKDQQMNSISKSIETYASNRGKKIII
jgi:hypothetical protein